MELKHRLLTLMLAPLAVLVSSSAMAVTVVNVFGNPATNESPSEGSWIVDLNAPGTLGITLVQADHSEVFEWTLSGPGPVSDSGTVFPSHPNVDGTGTLNISLGSWGAVTGSYSFSGTSYTLPGDNFEIEFSYDPSVVDPDPNFEYVVVTSVSTVPVPAAVWLFASGLLALVGIARRRKTT